MKSVPNTLFFKPMKEEPPKWVTAFGWSVFTPDGHISGRGIDNGLPCEMAFKLPYRPGEKCYVREAWMPDPPDNGEWDYCIFTDGCLINLKAIPDRYKHPSYCIYKATWTGPDLLWLPASGMPAWAARRFVVILSCEPMRVSEVTEEDCLAVGLKKITKDNGRTWKYGMADRDGLPGTDNTGWAWEDWKVDYKEAFKVWWYKRHPDKKWAWRIESEEETVAN